MANLWWVALIPILDLFFIVRMRGLLGTSVFLLWIAASALLGILAIRTGGFRIRSSRPPPETRFLDRSLVILAGLLLIFPGPASDVLGILLLIPGVRRRIAGRFLGTLLGRRIESLQEAWGRIARSCRAPSPGPEEGGESHKTGRSMGEYPGAEGARDVEFQEATRDKSGNPKTNKG